MAWRKLLQLHAANRVASLRIPPGNQPEALKGAARGTQYPRQRSMARVCFIWREDGAHQVQIVDHHQELNMAELLDEIHPGKFC